MTGWRDEPDPARLSAMEWALALTRLVVLAIVIYGLLIVLAITRLLESPFNARPVSPLIVQAASRAALFILRLPLKIVGRPMSHKGAIVANHASWLDIFTLNAAARVFFVSKAEVSKWPAIGPIARTTGTVFIERRASHAKKQQLIFEERLLNGDRLLFFPEGTSTDSRRVLGFKSTLFAAFFAPKLAKNLWIQPATVVYTAPPGEEPRYYGWWGGMDFSQHFLKILGARRAGSVEILFHEPVRVADFADRKALAKHCEDAVRRAFEERV